MSNLLKTITNKLKEAVGIKITDINRNEESSNDDKENVVDDTKPRGINRNNTEAIKKKQFRNLAIILVVLGIFLVIMYFVIADSSKGNARQKSELENFASPIKHIDAGSVLIQKVESRLAQAEKTTETLQKTVEVLNLEKERQNKEAASEQEKTNSLFNRITELEKNIEQMRAVPTVSIGTTFPGQVGASVLGSQEQNRAVLMTQGIRDDVIALEQNEALDTIPDKNPENYVPSGTFVKAITLGGADASAAVNAQSNPQPMLFRVIEDGTLPNNQKSRLKGCLATAAVVGDISSERGFIRLETLSCVDTKTGRITDLNVEGTVFGPEGRGGVRGSPMWREGALLQRAFAAGALSGLASGISQKYTQTSISPLGAISTTANNDVKDILARSGATGLGNAMEKLADYNIKRAEQYHPVLQLSAGTEVDLVFLKGFYLSDTGGRAEGNNKYKTMSMANNIEANTSNLNNMPRLTISPEQAEKLKAHTAELNKGN